MRRVPATHPDWSGNLLLSEEDDSIELEGHGSRGRYERQGSHLTVHWKDYPPDRFVLLGESFTHIRLLGTSKPTLPQTTVALHAPDAPNESNQTPAEKAWHFIWTGQPEALSALPTLQSNTWVGAAQADTRLYQQRGQKLYFDRSVGPALDQVCVIMMVKDEEDVIGANIDNLHRLGVRRFLILDNASSDQTGTILRSKRLAYQDSEIILVDDPTLHFTQAEKTTGLMRMALTFWPEVQWVFPIDADEFLCCETGMSRLVEVPAEADVILIQKANHFLAENERSEQQERHFTVTMPLRTHLGRQPPKVALRANTQFSIAPGNHSILAKDNMPLRHVPGLHFGFYYREFQFRNFTQFKSKVVNGGRGLRAAEQRQGRGSGGDHWKVWFQHFEERGDAGLLEVFRNVAVRSGVDLIEDPVDLS